MKFVNPLILVCICVILTSCHSYRIPRQLTLLEKSSVEQNQIKLVVGLVQNKNPRGKKELPENRVNLGSLMYLKFVRENGQYNNDRAEALALALRRAHVFEMIDYQSKQYDSESKKDINYVGKFKENTDLTLNLTDVCLIKDPEPGIFSKILSGLTLGLYPHTTTNHQFIQFTLTDKTGRKVTFELIHKETHLVSCFAFLVNLLPNWSASPDHQGENRFIDHIVLSVVKKKDELYQLAGKTNPDADADHQTDSTGSEAK